MIIVAIPPDKDIDVTIHFIQQRFSNADASYSESDGFANHLWDTVVIKIIAILIVTTTSRNYSMKNASIVQELHEYWIGAAPIVVVDWHSVDGWW